MRPDREQNDGDDTFDKIVELVEGMNQLADAQGFFSRTPMFRHGTDGLHLLYAMNAFLGMKSAELGKFIAMQIGPPQEWN